MSFAKVTKDIDALERKLGKSIKIASKGDKLSMGDVLKLGSKTSAIEKTLKSATKEYGNIEVTEAEAQEVLKRMVTIQALAQEQMELMVADKPQLEKLHTAGLVKSKMVRLEKATDDLAQMMVSKAPAGLKADAEALAKKSQDAYTKNLVAFADATGGEEMEGKEEDDSD